jgi:hypothetical protein
MMQAPFRADQVGSLLRPAALAETRARFKRGEVDAATLRAAEDQPGDDPFDVLALDQVMTELARIDPRLAELAQLHLYGGLSMAEIAELQDAWEGVNNGSGSERRFVELRDRYLGQRNNRAAAAAELYYAESLMKRGQNEDALREARRVAHAGAGTSRRWRKRRRQCRRGDRGAAAAQVHLWVPRRAGPCRRHQRRKVC